jgi:hypothetical protein
MQLWNAIQTFTITACLEVWFPFGSCCEISEQKCYWRSNLKTDWLYSRYLTLQDKTHDMQLCLKFYYTLQNVCNHYHYSKFENKNLNFSFSTELKTPITLATVYFSQNKISSKTPKFIYIFVLHLLPDGISLLVQKYEHRCMECWIS